RDFGVRRTLNAPEAREPQRGDSRPLPRPTFGRCALLSGHRSRREVLPRCGNFDAALVLSPPF
ncbi:MAG: hypothetical protein IJZ19_08520, partial [Lentisphaeria bacterium]|nr:hypothetical protein [Lentisphaeria bacterium]